MASSLSGNVDQIGLASVAADSSASPLAHRQKDSASRPAVLVLSTLHQYHAKVGGYGFEALRQILMSLAPQALFLEVTEENLLLRSDEQVKREYPEVVYPLLQAHPSIRPHALEPSGTIRTKNLERSRIASELFQATAPYAEFEAYVNSWFRQLLEQCGTAAEFNSEAADAAARAKHKYQDEQYGFDYSAAWAEWNQHFYDRIVDVVTRTRPRLAVVLVGFEHSYWLRPRLAIRPEFTLLDAYAELSKLGPS